MPTPLQRDLHRLSEREFDVVVVGGGIYGLTIACDAAQRGLAVALIEAQDFGSGTTFNHLRTIHGGLRYLQTLDIARARESIRERRTLAWIAPWAVQVLPFVLPLPRSVTRGGLAMRAAFLFDAIVGADRNDSVPPSHVIPMGRVLGHEQVRSRYPEAARLAANGAAVWHDYEAVEADRLTLSWALSAAEHGAVLANYVEARAFVSGHGRIAGVEALDRVDGAVLHLRARSVVNATGAQVNRLLTPFGADVRLPFLQAMNLVTRRPAPAFALGGRTTRGRHLFIVPWRGRALYGTWESDTTRTPNDLDVDEAEVTAFLAAINETFPGEALTREDVTLVHRGIVPAEVQTDGSLALEGQEILLEHRAEGLDGLVSVVGTKYTTARAIAQRVVDRLYVLLTIPKRPCISAHTLLPHVDLSGDELLHHAAGNEMVMTLADAVLRRTPLGALGCPDDRTLSHAAEVVGSVRGWSEARRADEIAAVRSLY